MRTTVKLLATTAALATYALALGPIFAAEAMPKKIGYVTNYATHEWYQNVIKGMKAHGKELGIDVEVQDSNLDIAKQVAATEDFIAKGVDVLIITPVNEEGVVPLLRKAKAANIPVVLEGHFQNGYYASDRIMVKHTADYVAQHPDRVKTAETTIPASPAVSSTP